MGCNFSIVVDAIRKTYPDAFADAAIEDSKLAWIAFSNDAPDDATDHLADFVSAFPGVTVEIRTGFGYSESELQRAIEAVHYEVLASVFVADVVTYHDSTVGHIVTQVVLTDDSGGELEAIGTRAASALLDEFDGAPPETLGVQVVEASDDVVGGTEAGENFRYGGEVLGGPKVCTSAFGVIDSGVRGISIALTT